MFTPWDSKNFISWGKFAFLNTYALMPLCSCALFAKQSQSTPKGVGKIRYQMTETGVKMILLKFLQYSEFPAYVFMDAGKVSKISNVLRNSK